MLGVALWHTLIGLNSFFFKYWVPSLAHYGDGSLCSVFSLFLIKASLKGYYY